MQCMFTAEEFGLLLLLLLRLASNSVRLLNTLCRSPTFTCMHIGLVNCSYELRSPPVGRSVCLHPLPLFPTPPTYIYSWLNPTPPELHFFLLLLFFSFSLKDRFSLFAVRSSPPLTLCLSLSLPRLQLGEVLSFFRSL